MPDGSKTTSIGSSKVGAAGTTDIDVRVAVGAPLDGGDPFPTTHAGTARASATTKGAKERGRIIEVPSSRGSVSDAGQPARQDAHRPEAGRSAIDGFARDVVWLWPG